MDQDLEVTYHNDNIDVFYNDIKLGSYFNKDYDLVIVLNLYPRAQVREVYALLKTLDIKGLKTLSHSGKYCYLTFDYRNNNSEIIYESITSTLRIISNHDFFIRRNRVVYQKQPVKAQFIKVFLLQFINIVWYFGSLLFARSIDFKYMGLHDVVFLFVSFSLLLVFNILFTRILQLFNEKKKFRNIINSILVYLPFLCCLIIQNIIVRLSLNTAPYNNYFQSTLLMMFTDTFGVFIVLTCIYFFLVSLLLLMENHAGVEQHKVIR